MNAFIDQVEKLEKLAARHRFQADHAGSDWISNARLGAAETLERRAAKLRKGEVSPTHCLKLRPGKRRHEPDQRTSLSSAPASVAD